MDCNECKGRDERTRVAVPAELLLLASRSPPASGSISGERPRCSCVSSDTLPGVTNTSLRWNTLDGCLLAACREVLECKEECRILQYTHYDRLQLRPHMP